MSLIKKISLPLLFLLSMPFTYANGDNHINKTTWPLQCFGTEPFWSFKLGKKVFIYDVPTHKKVTFKAVKPLSAQGAPKTYLRVYQTKALKSKKRATIVVKTNKEGCSDGMSDRKYAYDGIVIMGDKVLVGCCDLQSK
jgi:uncharacterized membrane protein